MQEQGTEPGTILLGKYRVESHLGTGGMGVVVRASHLHLQQSVAIKILLKSMAESESTVARFLREAQAAVRLRSEHTARVMDVGTLDDGRPFMIMEFLEGNDLGMILKHHGPQPANVVVDLVLQACEGLAEAHAHGIVHRDIKPSNFFITHQTDGTLLLKVLDFGISKAPVGYDDLTSTQTVIGTPTYMAPEQMRSGKLADARSDVWSLGIVMHQLIAGVPPFSGETYAELVLKVGTDPPAPLIAPGVSPGLADVVLRCLEKDPTKRIQDMGELARALAPFAMEPGVAHMSAQRATRILATRAGQDMSSSSGGLRRDSLVSFATPMPYTPGPHTPRSNPSAGSLNQGHGQVFGAAPKKSRGWIVGGVLALVIAAGVGGLLAARSGDDVPVPSTPATSPPPVVMDPTPPKAEPAVAPPIQPAVPVDAAPVVVEAVDAAPTVAAPADAAVVEPADAAVAATVDAAVEEKVPPTKTPVATPAKTPVATPTKTPTKTPVATPTKVPTKKPAGNLFDRRD